MTDTTDEEGFVLSIGDGSRVNDLCIGCDPDFHFEPSPPGYGIVYNTEALVRRDVVVSGALQLVRCGVVLASVDAVYDFSDVPDEYHAMLVSIVPQPMRLLLPRLEEG